MAKTETIQTTLKMDKICKSCVRYRSIETEEIVTTSLYLQNEAYTKLGNPETIVVTVERKS